MSKLSVLAITAVLSIVVVDPAMARPNNGSFNKSSEGFKKQLAADCAYLKEGLDKNEAEADKRAGTKAAKKYADAADVFWETAASLGCSWAK